MADDGAPSRIAAPAQPVDQPWNVQGMANNMAHRVTVVVS